jgi:hypothetical protein
MAALFVIELILGLAFVAVFGLFRLQDQIPRYPSHCSPFLDDDEEDDTMIDSRARSAGSPHPR